MADEVLWARDVHTAAKHAILTAYIGAWIPVMAYQSQKMGDPRLLIVDGFAGPGRYVGGEPGSPLLLIKSLLDHPHLRNFDKVKFNFLFIEHDVERFKHLEDELDKLSIPSNVHVTTVHGEFEDSFGEIVEGVASSDGRTLIPTFAFIDPFGYSQASMSLTGRFLEFPRSEALFFLPLSYVQRFVSRAGQEAAMTSLFNTDRWKQTIPLQGTVRREALLKLFEEQLRSQGEVKHVRSFRLVTGDGNDYRLVFATGHDRGLELMKGAMWKVDPVRGTEFRATTTSGQEVLFEPTADTGPLLRELRAEFGDRSFTVAEASKITLLNTPFIPSSHLKTKTLKPAEKNGVIAVRRPEGSRAGTFGDDVKMSFLRSPD